MVIIVTYVWNYVYCGIIFTTKQDLYGSISIRTGPVRSTLLLFYKEISVFIYLSVNLPP